METLKKEDLKEGEIYKYTWKCENKYLSAIFRFLEFNNQHRQIKYAFSIFIGQDRIKSNHNFDYSIGDTINNINSEEKHWFLECEKANKFISKEEAMKSFKKQPEFVVGKWYESIISNTITVYFKFNGWDILSKKLSKTDIIRYPYKFDITTVENDLWWKGAKECSVEEIQQYLPNGHEDKIVKSKNMFVKDDYIVLLKGPEDYHYKVNFCYKQRENNSYLSTYLDSRNSSTNGWTVYDFDKTKELGGVKTDWRYATKEEIAEYDRLGKPYDVTTLSKTNVNINLIKGKYYVAEFPSKPEWDSIFISGGELINNSRVYINPSNHKYEKGGGSWAIDSYKINFREANINEIKWLDDCIKNNKFVPKESSTELTSLPEKWFIKRTPENYRVINKWFTDNGYGTPLANNSNISIIPNKNNYDTGGDEYNISQGKVKITFEQFKKWVLKEDTLNIKVEPGDTVFNCKIEKNCVVVSDFDYDNNNPDIKHLPYVTEGAVKSYGHTFVKKGNDFGYIPKFKQEEKSLVGRYVKILIDWNSIKKNQYLKILLHHSEDIYHLEEYGPFARISNRDMWELMPEGFEPSKVEPHEIPTKSNSKKVDIEEILNICKEKYKNAKKVKCARYQSTDNSSYEIKERIYISENVICNGNTSYLYVNGIYAEITEYKEDLLEEAKRRYPIGTICRPAHLILGKESFKIRGNYRYNTEGDVIVDVDQKEWYTPVIFDKNNSKWAEIVEEPKYKSGLDPTPEVYKDFYKSSDYHIDYLGKTIIEPEYISIEENKQLMKELNSPEWKSSELVKKYTKHLDLSQDNEVVIIKQNKRKPKLVTI